MSGSSASPAGRGWRPGTEGIPSGIDQRRAHAPRLDLEVALDARVRAPHEPELVVRRVVGDGGVGGLVGVDVAGIGVGDPRRVAGRRAGRRHDLADDLLLAGRVVRAGRRRRDVGQHVGVDGRAVAERPAASARGAGHRRQPADDPLRACRCRRAPARRPRSRRARRVAAEPGEQELVVARVVGDRRVAGREREVAVGPIWVSFCCAPTAATSAAWAVAGITSGGGDGRREESEETAGHALITDAADQAVYSALTRA